ncbi:hypothetical protein STEG23_027231, partial [Scotinomys teguina]
MVEGGGGALRKGLKSEKFAHSLISGRSGARLRLEFQLMKIQMHPPKVSAIRAPSTQEETRERGCHTPDVKMIPRRSRVRRGNLRKPKMRFHLLNRFTLMFLLLITPTPVLQAPSNISEPTSNHEPFLYLVGRKKLLDAQYKCYDRIQEMPPYDGE